MKIIIDRKLILFFAEGAAERGPLLELSTILFPPTFVEVSYDAGPNHDELCLILKADESDA